jgi:hypothetical protein
MRYKNQRYQRGLLMVSYVGMYTRSYKKIKTRMETIIGFYGKGNEIISYHSLYVGSRLVLNSNCCCMHCHCQNMLHQIYISWIGNDNFIKVWKLSLIMTISICLLVWQGKKWKTSLYTWAPSSDAIATTIFWTVSWVIMCSLSHGQHNKWIPKSSMVWPHWHRWKCVTIRCGIPKEIQNVVKNGQGINKMKGC